MNKPQSVAVIGASLAGVAVAESLRTRGFDGEITLYGDEAHLPYDRPPLSKSILTGNPGEIDELLLKPAQWYEDLNIKLRLGEPVRSLDAEHRSFIVGNDQQTADHVVIATGSSPRRLPNVCEDEDVFYLRTWQDATRFSQRLATPGQLVILGAGFIGLEVAASAVERGWKVTLLEYADRPLGRVLPAELGALCTSHYDGNEAELRTGIAVSNVIRRGNSLVAIFENGEELSADAVVVAAGGIPNTQWLENSGLVLDNGVRCDGWGRTSSTGIYAAGDVACWKNAFTGENTRVEQWQAALEQGSILASTILGQDVQAWSDAPYFWSDLLGGRIQFIGSSAADSRVHVVTEGEKNVALIGNSKGELIGVLARSNPKAIIRARKLLAASTSFEEAMAWADSLATRTLVPS